MERKGWDSNPRFSAFCGTLWITEEPTGKELMLLESLGTAGHTMASLYQRPTSKFWWVKYRDPANGKIERESTKCRIGIGAHTRRAREICAEKTKLEKPSSKRETAAWLGHLGPGVPDDALRDESEDALPLSRSVKNARSLSCDANVRTAAQLPASTRSTTLPGVSRPTTRHTQKCFSNLSAFRGVYLRRNG